MYVVLPHDELQPVRFAGLSVIVSSIIGRVSNVRAGAYTSLAEDARADDSFRNAPLRKDNQSAPGVLDPAYHTVVILACGSHVQR